MVLRRSLCLTLIGLVLAGFLVACNSPEPPRLPPELQTVAATSPFPTVTVTLPLPPPSLIPSLTASATETVAPSEIPPSATPDPYAQYEIEALAARSYGNGELRAEQTLTENNYFTRYLVTYPSDDLTIYGFEDVPNPERWPGVDRFPVVIASHGYIDPSLYQTLDYTTGYADALARAGYLVLHPNLRNFPPSDDGPDLFRVGMAVDVLNLIGLVKKQAGKPGSLELADPQRIGLWGHSMGGGITTRVMTVSPDIDAAVLYGAMSGDEAKNYERIYNVFSDRSRGLEELAVPPQEYLKISPVYFYDRIQAAVSIHHGGADELVPPEWSQELCRQLQEIGKTVECFTYKGQPHTFFGDNEQLFIERTIDFYDRFLKAP